MPSQPSLSCSSYCSSLLEPLSGPFRIMCSSSGAGVQLTRKKLTTSLHNGRTSDTIHDFCLQTTFTYIISLQNLNNAHVCHEFYDPAPVLSKRDVVVDENKIPISMFTLISIWTVGILFASRPRLPLRIENAGRRSYSRLSGRYIVIICIIWT